MEVERKKAELKTQFRKHDKNGDNKLDFNEFLSLMDGLDTRSAHKLFEKVDKTGDGTIDFDEFVDYIYSRQDKTSSSRHARLRAAATASQDSEDPGLWATCESVFDQYQGSDKRFEGKDWKKLCLDCKLFDRKFSRNDVDLVFAKCKSRGKNTLTFEEFKNCIRQVAQKKGVATQAVQAAVAERETVGVETNATQADFVRFHDDKTTYTGQHNYNDNHRGSSPQPGLASRRDRIREEEAAANEGVQEEMDWAKVHDAFEDFCKGDKYMDGKEFTQMCEDCELYERGAFMQVDADIIFNKVKNRGERKIDFEQFQDACVSIARKRGCSVKEVQALIISSGGPKLHGVTQADNVRFHDDKSLYTGIHASD